MKLLILRLVGFIAFAFGCDCRPFSHDLRCVAREGRHGHCLSHPEWMGQSSDRSLSRVHNLAKVGGDPAHSCRGDPGLHRINLGVLRRILEDRLADAPACWPLSLGRGNPHSSQPGGLHNVQATAQSGRWNIPDLGIEARRSTDEDLSHHFRDGARSLCPESSHPSPRVPLTWGSRRFV